MKDAWPAWLPEWAVILLAGASFIFVAFRYFETAEKMWKRVKNWNKRRSEAALEYYGVVTEIGDPFREEPKLRSVSLHVGIHNPNPFPVGFKVTKLDFTMNDRSSALSEDNRRATTIAKSGIKSLYVRTNPVIYDVNSKLKGHGTCWIVLEYGRLDDDGKFDTTSTLSIGGNIEMAVMVGGKVKSRFTEFEGWDTPVEVGEMLFSEGEDGRHGIRL